MMLNERIAELIQADLDGELEQGNRAELDSALAASGDARKLREDLGRVVHLMSNVPDREPPAELHRRLMDSIVLPSKPRFAMFNSLWESPFSHGLALAAGVLLAVGVTQVGHKQPASVEDLVGTMVRNGNDAPGAASSVLKVDSPVVQGQIRLKPMDKAWVLEFDLASSDAVDIKVDLGATGFTFGGFASRDEAVENFVVAGSKVHLKNQGNHGFALFLLDGPSHVEGPRSIEVAVDHLGNNVFQGMLEDSTGG